MHIVMVFSTALPAREGIGSHVLELARGLRACGHHITLLKRGAGRRDRECEFEGFRCIEVAFYPIYPLHVYLEGVFLRRTLLALRPQPDLVHLHTPLVPAIAQRWPIVTTFHTAVLVDTRHMEGVGIRSRFIKLMGRTTSVSMEKRLLARSHAIICVSAKIKKELEEYYHYSGQACCVIPNVVDLDLFVPAEKMSVQRTLLYIGRLSYRKGLLELLRSAGQVVRIYPDIIYRLIGEGPLEPFLRRYVEKSGLSRNIFFCGPVFDRKRIVQEYQQAYAVLIPSYYEGMSMTLLESMACGKAIIATTACENDGFLVDNGNAVLIHPGSAEELCAATIRLLGSEKHVRMLGSAARETVLSATSINVHVARHEEVYAYAQKSFDHTNEKARSGKSRSR